MYQLIQLVFKSLKVYELGLGIKGGNSIVLLACCCRVQTGSRLWDWEGSISLQLQPVTPVVSWLVCTGLGEQNKQEVLRAYAQHKFK